jgi:two-component system OmpR family response regulator
MGLRLLIVEDDAVLADGMSGFLRQRGYAVECLADGAHADQALATGDYDLVILDLGLPRLDGFEVLQRLRARRKKTPVLVLTARDELEDRVKGLDLGADDYVTKPFELVEIEARIRALVRRSLGEASPALEIGRLSLDMAARRALLGGKPVEMTAREYGVLEILMTRSGRVVSKEQMNERLCEPGEELAENAIEVYVSRVRKKIDASGVSIRTVRGFGYMLEKARDA